MADEEKLKLLHLESSNNGTKETPAQGTYYNECKWREFQRVQVSPAPSSPLPIFDDDVDDGGGI